MSEHKLLLMFLGGVPNSNNIINHWIKINSEFINKNNIFLRYYLSQGCRPTPTAL